MIAAAQVTAVPGDLVANIQGHLQVATVAHEQGVHLLVFPELSLTGYELGLATACAIRPDDFRLNPLRDLARLLRITLVVGAPLLQSDGSLHISALIFHPDGASSTYAKQHVHSSEQPPFVSGNGGSLIPLEGDQVALAICRDASIPSHFQAAAASGATVYAASVMVDEESYPSKAMRLRQRAATHGIAVLLANYSGITGGVVSAGRSAIWSETGHLVAASPDASSALVVAHRAQNGWTGSVIAL
jgi:predicted amidohydrolase